MRSFAITSFVVSLLTASTLAAPTSVPVVETVGFAAPSGTLNSPANGTHIASSARNGIISVLYTPIHTPRYYNTKSIDLYLTPWPVADFGAFIANGKKIASQLSPPDTSSPITATFGVEGFCGPHYLVVVENLISGSSSDNVVDHPYIMIEC